MAGQPGSGTSASATATLVGNAFVSQYYNVLHQSSHHVHRFYTDLSKLSRAEVGANADIVETQDKIQEKIMSMDLDGVQANIKTVDSLASLNGSVLVMVTGLLSNRSGLQRNFVQTFFLAPQERGYFVLSDIRRVLDGVGDQPTQVPDVIPEHSTAVNAVEQVHEVPVPSSDENVADSLLNERDLTDSLHESVEEEKVCTPLDTPVEDDRTPIVDNASSQQQPVVPRLEEQPPPVKEESSEGATKMSYASILRESSGASFTTRQAGPRKATPAQTVPVSPISVSQGGASQATSAYSSDAAEESATDGGDGYSVYVKNLPSTISQEDLENEFQKFGSVKQGGVTLRNQKPGVCFAFIQFDESSAARSAIEASPISIGGRQVYIEEKKPTLTGPTAGRGGRAGSGRGFQADGMNGRGNFGGRNLGRGGYNSERDFNSSRGRGGRANNYGSNGNSSNGFRRGDSHAGNGARPARRGYTDQ